VTQAPPGAQARAEGARGPGEAAVPARCERRGLPPVTAPSPCCRRCLRARPRHLRTHRLRNNRLRRYGVRKYRLRRQSGRRACGSPAAPEPRAPGRGPGLPKYLRLERKELLIWPDQITNLSILARVLNRNRGGADNHEHAYPRCGGAAAQPVPGPGRHAGGRTPPLARTPGLTDSGPPELAGRGLPSGRGDQRCNAASTAAAHLLADQGNAGAAAESCAVEVPA
jgi:hypothetical protein